MDQKKFLNNLFPFTSEELSQLQNIIKNFSSKQLAWLSGYFWNLSDQKLKHKKINDVSPVKVTIISASQTGNARQIAFNLSEQLIKVKINVNLFNAGDYQFKKIDQEKFLILITSTQGEGEPPEEAITLYKYLMSKKGPNLKKTQFSVFGLGDRSYPKFNQAGKDFDRRLFELGGVRLFDRIDADINYEEESKLWQEKILSKLLKIIPEHNNIIFSKTSIKKEASIYNKKNPYKASIISNQKITGRNSEKDVRHIEIDLNNSNIHYNPGDTLGVWYENDALLIQELLTVLNLNGDEILNINNMQMSLSHALKKNFELTVNTSKIVENYAKLSKNKKLLSLISDKQKLNNYLKATPIIDMFRTEKTYVTSDQLLSLLRPLTPRFYSISSSQLDNQNEVHITVSVVRYNVNTHLRTGGASGYLSNREENSTLKIFIEPNKNFRLPDKLDTPIIMIGVGTGIAPFRAFMQERDVQEASGKNWLFFGNPHFTEDFLYQVEWQSYIKKKLLTKIHLAWSRDQKSKIYIQNKLLEQGFEIWNWIQNNAHIYVCGSANPMAKDVEIALLKILIKYGNMKEEKAEDYLNELRMSHRYQRDVY